MYVQSLGRLGHAHRRNRPNPSRRMSRPPSSALENMHAGPTPFPSLFLFLSLRIALWLSISLSSIPLFFYSPTSTPRACIPPIPHRHFVPVIPSLTANRFSIVPRAPVRCSLDSAPSRYACLTSSDGPRSTPSPRPLFLPPLHRLLLLSLSSSPSPPLSLTLSPLTSHSFTLPPSPLPPFLSLSPLLSSPPLFRHPQPL